jgi:hypothetical protein
MSSAALSRQGGAAPESRLLIQIRPNPDLFLRTRYGEAANVQRHFESTESDMTILAKTDGTTLTAASRWALHDVFRRKQGCQGRFARSPDVRIRFGPLPVNQPRHTPSRLAA